MRFLIFALFAAASAATDPAPVVSAREPHVDFGKVLRGTVIERAFTITNEGAVPLRVRNVRLTPPMLPTDVPTEIPPRAQATVRITLDTSTLSGSYEGIVLLSFREAGAGEVRLAMTGRVVLPVEVVPPAVVATAQRGETRQVSVEIVNHEEEPVLVGVPRHSRERFTTRLETLEEGRRYRLTLLLRPDGPSGRNRETILLKTSSAAVPELKVPAFTFLRERVYTFPEAVDMGVLRLEDIRRSPEMLKATAQTLMVYRKDAPGFEAKVSTDVPQLTVTSARGPLGDRYQVIVSVVPEAVRPGPIQGSIVIETNDPEFPRLTVPVSGEIVRRGGEI